MGANTNDRVKRLLNSYRNHSRELRAFAFAALMVTFAVTMLLRRGGIAATHTEQILDCHYVGTAAHTHDASCYDASGNLVCPLPEVEAHSHTDACYTETRELACGMDEHTHEDACYDEDGNLTCEQPEHVHTDACYRVSRELTCGQAEVTETHVHGPGCFAAVEVEDEAPADDQPAEEAYDTQEDVTAPEDVETDAAPDLAEAADAEAAATMPAQKFSHSFKDKDDQLVFRVDVDAPEGALPEGSAMVAQWVDAGSLSKKQQAAVADAVAVKAAGVTYAQQAVDIAFTNADGMPVVPARRVVVTFSTSLLDTQDLPVIAHIDDLTEQQLEAQTKALEEGATAEEAEPKRTAQALDEVSEQALAELGISLANNQRAVATDAFSTFVLNVTTLDHAMKAEGETVRIEAEAPAAAGLPADASLQVREVAPGSTEYASYEVDALAAAGALKAQLARFFEITIVRADGTEVAPLQPVAMKVKLSDAPADEASSVMRFVGTEPAELLPSEVNNLTSKFDYDTAGVYGVVYAAEPRWNVAGAEAALELPVTGSALLSGVATQLGVSDDDLPAFVADIAGVESSSEHVFGARAEADTTVGALKEAHGVACEYPAGVTEEQVAAADAALVPAGDWAIFALVPFDGEGVLTVTMADGETFTVRVTSVHPKSVVLTAAGDDYTVTVTAGPEAQIPAGAELTASEYAEGTDEYNELLANAISALGGTDKQINFARFFDITIWAGETKVEPQAPVSVAIGYPEGVEQDNNASMQVVHFADEGVEVLENNASEQAGVVSEVAFETEGFSDFGTISQRITPQMAQGCIAYLSFDDVNAGFTGAGATANKVGNPELRGGYSGTSLYLNGNNYLTVAKSNGGSLLTGLDEFTVSYWTSRTESTSDGSHGNWAYYAAPNGNGQTWQQERYVATSHTGSGLSSERYNNNGARPPAIEVNNATPMGNWHHVTIVYRNNKTEAYVDGELVGSVDSQVDLSNMLGNNSVFQIGRANWGSGEGYRGYLDEFSVYNYAMSEDEVRLLHESAYYQEAEKISVQQLQDGGSYIIYNEVWNPNAGLTGAYEYYAIDGNGNLVKVYNKSDLIYYRGDTSLEWKLTAYTEGGQETGYYEFYNEETGKYLAPQAAQLLSDAIIGLHLDGRQDGKYDSTIEAWDEGAMTYYGYKCAYDTASGKWILAAAPENETVNSRDWEFFFAKPDDISPVAQLETVTTVQNPPGLTIQMFDYPAAVQNYTQGHSSYSSTQNSIISGISGSGGNNWNEQHVTQGLVNNTLDGGYPKSTATGQSLSPLFSNGKTVDHLFIQSTYDESGYYEYSSFENYAYLGNNSNFTVYKQIGAMDDWHEDNEPIFYYQRGNFMPYNSIVATSITTHNWQKNYRDEFGQPLSTDDPRYGETIYRAQGNLNYNFGMSIGADFSMPYGGEDARGNPVTFEFNGDDDMWVFVDGVLLLDMGGTHHAHSGSINFATGDIVIQNLHDQYTTTIVDQFRAAHVYPDGTPWPEGDDSLFDKYFIDNEGNGKYTFRDFTAHKLQMYYMERGGGASNLHVKFNLPMLTPGTLKVSKSVGKVDPRYVNHDFWYQLCGYQGVPISHIGGNSDDVKSIVNEATGAPISIDSQGRFSLKAGETAVITVGSNTVHYTVKELGMDPNEYDVSMNGKVTPIDGTGTASSGEDTVGNRPILNIDNTPKHLGGLLVTKQVEADVKETPSPEFEFYAYLEDQSGNLVPYSQGEYYVMKGDRYCEYVNGALVELAEGVVPSAPLKTGQYGAIARIPDGYSFYIPKLMPGTHFLVTERLDQIPAGYYYVGKELTANTYNQADAGKTYNGTTIVQDTGKAADGKIKADTIAEAIVTNRPAGKIVAEKVWAGEFDGTHGDVYAALYRRTGSGTSTQYELVEGTVKKLAYDTTAQKYRVEYYLPVAQIDNYVVREVKVTFGDGGAITNVEMVDDGGSILVSGELPTGSEDPVDNTYAVSYTTGEASEYDLPAGSYNAGAASNGKGQQRVDTITNTPNDVTLSKVDGTGTALNGAVFRLWKVNSDPAYVIPANTPDSTDATGDLTSRKVGNVDGVIVAGQTFELGTYLIKEISAPTGYIGLDHRLVMRVTANGTTLTSEDGITRYENKGTNGSSSYAFEVVNSNGAELPKAGGAGIWDIYATGIAMIAGAASYLLLRLVKQRA